tara:strand:- start:464 stop:802 length:339 start_codon:yes stop_codon:yes gene_type:complete
MKKIVLLIVTLFSLNAVTYASFPVTENGTTTELVADDANLAMEAPYGSDFNWGGFLLGFFLGLIGVLIAYLIDPDWLKSSLYGILALFAVYLILLFTVFAAVGTAVASTPTY